jgi:hypothetical protein
MTSPYLLIPPRTLAQVLADATERAIRDLRGRNQHGNGHKLSFGSQQGLRVRRDRLNGARKKLLGQRQGSRRPPRAPRAA